MAGGADVRYASPRRPLPPYPAQLTFAGASAAPSDVRLPALTTTFLRRAKSRTVTVPRLTRVVVDVQVSSTSQRVPRTVADEYEPLYGSGLTRRPTASASGASRPR